MPTPTYTPLATVTLTSSASSVTFSNIPATYRDLIVVSSPITTNNNTDFLLRLNSDGGSNYFHVTMEGPIASGAGTRTGLLSGFKITGSSITTSITQIMDYSATDKHKTALNRWNDGAGSYVWALATRWANTNAVNTISAVLASGSFSSGSTFSLYGVIA
jgi:hypothetical protein